MAQSAGAAEYPDCFSAEEIDSSSEYPVMWHLTIWSSGSSNAGALGNAEYSFIAIAPRSTLA